MAQSHDHTDDATTLNIGGNATVELRDGELYGKAKTGNKQWVAVLTNTHPKYNYDRDFVFYQKPRITDRDSGTADFADGAVVEHVRFTHSGKNRSNNYYQVVEGKAYRIDESDVKTAIGGAVVADVEDEDEDGDNGGKTNESGDKEESKNDEGSPTVRADGGTDIDSEDPLNADEPRKASGCWCHKLMGGRQCGACRDGGEPTPAVCDDCGERFTQPPGDWYSCPYCGGTLSRVEDSAQYVDFHAEEPGTTSDYLKDDGLKAHAIGEGVRIHGVGGFRTKGDRYILFDENGEKLPAYVPKTLIGEPVEFRGW